MKSLDLQMLLPKSTEVAKSRHLQQQRPETAQQQFALEGRRQVVTQQRTVRHTEQSRGGKINRDGRRGSGNPGAGSRDSGSSSGGRPQSGAGGTAPANVAFAVPALPVQAHGEPRSDQDGKGKLIDIVLGSSSCWGTR